MLCGRMVFMQMLRFCAKGNPDGNDGNKKNILVKKKKHGKAEEDPYDI